MDLKVGNPPRLGHVTIRMEMNRWQSTEPLGAWSRVGPVCKICSGPTRHQKVKLLGSQSNVINNNTIHSLRPPNISDMKMAGGKQEDNMPLSNQPNTPIPPQAVIGC